MFINVRSHSIRSLRLLTSNKMYQDTSTNYWSKSERFASKSSLSSMCVYIIYLPCTASYYNNHHIVSRSRLTKCLQLWITRFSILRNIRTHSGYIIHSNTGSSQWISIQLYRKDQVWLHYTKKSYIFVKIDDIFMW